jgi:hypothetical protein
MKHPRRLSVLFLIGLLAAGSTALGYYYYFVYEPPLGAAEAFMKALANRDIETLKTLVMVTPDRDSTDLRKAKPEEITSLLKEPFKRGRVLDQDRRSGGTRNYDFLVYRQPDGSIYALLAAQVGKDFKIVIPESPQNPKAPFLWDYDWTN